MVGEARRQRFIRRFAEALTASRASFCVLRTGTVTTLLRATNLYGPIAALGRVAGCGKTVVGFSSDLQGTPFPTQIEDGFLFKRVDDATPSAHPTLVYLWRTGSEKHFRREVLWKAVQITIFRLSPNFRGTRSSEP